MPLSNDFTNTRLSYLQDAIKNTKIVAEQFYPRFVREYNEQFPFTEPKLSSIGNPISNTSVKGYLNRRTKEQIIEDLSTKIQTLTNDENVTRFIIRALVDRLDIGNLNYYDENFDSIQSKITIPRDGISKESFITKVLMALRNEPHKSNLSIYNEPAPDAPATETDTKREAPDIFNHINEEPIIPLDLKSYLIPKQSFLRDTIKLPKKEKPIFNDKSPSPPLKSDEISTILREKNAVKLPDTIKLPKNGKKIFNDESPSAPLKSLPVLQRKSVEPLAESTFLRQRGAVPLEESLPVLQRESVLPLAESLSLLQRKSVLPLPEAVPVMEQVAEKHSSEKLPFLEELKAVDAKPVKSRGRMAGIPNHDNRIREPTDEQLVQEIVKRLGMNPKDITEEFFNTYKTAYLKPDPKASITSAPTTRSTTKSKNLSLGVSSGSYILSNKKKKGKGIQLKPLRIQNRIIKHKQVFNNNKYAIDTKKLKKNILDLKYVKNANHVATFQPIEISDKLRYIIDNIIKDFYNVQNEDFNNLNTTEKRILKRLFTFLNIQNNTLNESSYSDKNDSIQHNFEVAYGSFLAGNTNKELINELINYVKLALHENTISKKDGYEILKKLNNK